MSKIGTVFGIRVFVLHVHVVHIVATATSIALEESPDMDIRHI